MKNRGRCLAVLPFCKRGRVTHKYPLLAARSEYVQHTTPLCLPGQLNKDVTYAHFYSFLNCLQVSPHWPVPRPHSLLLVLLLCHQSGVFLFSGQPLPQLDVIQQDAPDSHFGGRTVAGPLTPSLIIPSQCSLRCFCWGWDSGKAMASRLVNKSVNS